MEEIININKATINNEEVNAVNARDLWKRLGSKQRFADWIKDRLEGFTEGQDYVFHKIVKNLPAGGRPEIEYIISLDVAKHIAMLERNEQGKKIRQYFREVEKQCRQLKNSIISQKIAEIMMPMVLEEQERLKMERIFIRHFLPQPGEPGKDGKSKNFYRRGFYISRNGKPVTALVERHDQPGLFYEVELKKIG